MRCSKVSELYIRYNAIHIPVITWCAVGSPLVCFFIDFLERVFKEDLAGI